jgi:hypothetical protein
VEDLICGTVMSDNVVVLALADVLNRNPVTLRLLMKRWEKKIFKVPIPGLRGRVPTKDMLDMAKTSVIRFFEAEEKLGMRSDVAKAFYLASAERDLRFDWDGARQRVRRAKLDVRSKVSDWKDCLGMVMGPTNATSEIYICGTRKVTLQALTALVCHEGLHNFARRTRKGNPFLGEDTEHVAMALIGDPQLTA